MPARSADTYVFIDGEYLRRRYVGAIQDVFQSDGEIDFGFIKHQAAAKRAFFYDCVDDEKRSGEADADHLKRVEAQESYFRKIGDLQGFHIRLGSLRGAPKKRRQKEVDVLLVADMLTHGYDGNMDKAILIAGDLDFRPVVEALVRRGVFVEVWYEPKSGAAELPGAADYGRKLDFKAIYAWSTYEFKLSCKLPKSEHSVNPENVGVARLRAGQYQGRNVLSMRQTKGELNFLFRVEWSHGVAWYEHADQHVLERYFSAVYGTIAWS